jgi:hypothetical protein
MVFNKIKQSKMILIYQLSYKPGHLPYCFKNICSPFKKTHLSKAPTRPPKSKTYLHSPKLNPPSLSNLTPPKNTKRNGTDGSSSSSSRSPLPSTTSPTTLSSPFQAKSPKSTTSPKPMPTSPFKSPFSSPQS